MQKNEFEKQVQQKMDELKLHPSDSVWLNVKTNIAKKKRRNLAWILLPLLLICLGSGYLLMNSVSKSKTHEQNELSEVIIKNDSLPGKNQSLKLDVTKKGSPGKMDVNIHSSKKVQGENQVIKIYPQTFNEKVKKKISSQQDNHNAGPVRIIAKNKTDQYYVTKSKSSAHPDEIVLADNKDAASVDGSDLKKKVSATGERNDAYETSNNNINNSDSLPVKNIVDSSKKIKDAESIITSKEGPVVKGGKSKNNWRLGFTFSGGISGVSAKFLGSLEKTYAVADGLYASTANQNNALITLPSSLKSSTGLIAGFYIEKEISKMSWLTIGLNYKMFTSTNQVGKKNDTTQRYNLANVSAVYHNHYHFLEIPVSLKAQISNKEIPLFWDAGVSISQLIGSNALQFSSSNSGSYYQDNSLFNKSQVGFNTGLSVSLFSLQNTSLLIGPYINYGLTKAAKEGLYKNQHFNFIGLRSQILFKK
jgi:hypothetical protein